MNFVSVTPIYNLKWYNVLWFSAIYVGMEMCDSSFWINFSLKFLHTTLSVRNCYFYTLVLDVLSMFVKLLFIFVLGIGFTHIHVYCINIYSNQWRVNGGRVSGKVMHWTFDSQNCCSRHGWGVRTTILQFLVSKIFPIRRTLVGWRRNSMFKFRSNKTSLEFGTNTVTNSRTYSFIKIPINSFSYLWK